MTITCTANDFFALTSRRVNDAGHLVARGTIARPGIQSYRRMELGFDTDPLGQIRLLRPPEEVFAADSMASFEGRPITIEHPAGMTVDASNREAVTKGHARKISRVGDMLDAEELTFTDPAAVLALDSGKNQLSNGYTFELDMTAGVDATYGAYDGVQRKIRGNHVALVDSARCGSACRVADSKPIHIGDHAMTTQKITVDGIPVEVSDHAAAVITKLQGTLAATTAQLKSATDSMSTMVTAADHALVVTARDAALKDVMTPAARDAMVADWAGLLTEAKRLVPTIATDGKTCHALRKEVITALTANDGVAKDVAAAVLGTGGVDGATEATIKSVFDAVRATVKTGADATNANDAATAAALLGKSVTGADGEVKLSGRDAAMKASSEAWQTK